MPIEIARRDLLKFGAGLAVTTACGSVWAASAPGNVARTTNGPVRGLTGDGVQIFKGIRYGAPPTGPLRFMPPQRPKPWTDVIDAHDFGSPAIQGPAVVGKPGVETQATKALETITAMFYAADKKPVSEDCLFLNVWTPSTVSGKRPVMVWLHGGGSAIGSAASNLYEGSNLARKADVVLVTANHRLGVLGFLHLGDLMGPRYAKSGNASLLDLVFMLGWVRDNIAAFGGDPTNVTIFGHGGGGAKVATLMGMPAAQGLFHKAILQSARPLKAPREAATETARAILAELNIKPGDIESLQTIPAMRLLEVANGAGSRPSVASSSSSAAPRFAPVIDGEVIKSDYWEHDAPAESRSIPLLVGFNKDEATLLGVTEEWFGRLTEAQMRERAAAMFGPRSAALIDAYRAEHPDYSPTYIFTGLIGARMTVAPAYQIAQTKVAQGGAPVWMYYLAWTTPIAGGVLKSPHSLDVPLVFDNIDFAAAFVGDGAGAKKLAHEMSTAWVAFARTGNPNTASLPKWPAFDSGRRAAMRFDSTTRVVSDPDGAVVRAMSAGNPVAA